MKKPAQGQSLNSATLERSPQAIRQLVAISLLAVAIVGCAKRDSAIRPQSDGDLYQSPLKRDRDRTGDYRPDGIATDPRQLPSPQPANPLPDVTTSTPSSSSQSTPSKAPPANIPAGQSILVGAVVANVNGTPIYAHDLLRQVTPVLRPRAKDLDENAFRKLATQELTRQRDSLIRDELVYAAALRNTTLDEQDRAKFITNMIFERFVSEAGGSREVARQRMREQGQDFDEMIKQEYRRALVSIYYRKRVFPRANISVEEMRQFYIRNRESRFTEQPALAFRMIRLDPKEIGDPALARTRATEARDRARAGESFEQLARDMNREPFLVERGGLIGPISRGSFRFPGVEKIAWETPVGQVSDIIEDEGLLFLVLPTERKEGRVASFDEPAVQEQIEQAIREVRMLEVQEREQQRLRAEALITAEPAMLEPAIDMAMQLRAQLLKS
jgi:parvulin-like peptidyl-prolyl isomerase